MRIERLTDDRVRVTVTMADLISLNINIEQLRPDSKELHTFLFNIMETIKEETGFNPYNGQVVVEATPSADGMSIIVSKITGENFGSKLKKCGKIKSVTPHIKKSKSESFFFEDMDALCGALTRLEDAAVLKSALFKAEKGYYIVLHSARRFSQSLGILFEYANRSKCSEEFICEHYDLVCEKEKLLEMADGIKQLENNT